MQRSAPVPVPDTDVIGKLHRTVDARGEAAVMLSSGTQGQIVGYDVVRPVLVRQKLGIRRTSGEVW